MNERQPRRNRTHEHIWPILTEASHLFVRVTVARGGRCSLAASFLRMVPDGYVQSL